MEKKRIQARYKGGFSLLEMTVVIAIVAVMTAIVLWNMPNMKGGASIDVVAQEVAIYLRGAQVYSRATRTGADYGTAGDFTSYGIHLSTSASAGGESDKTKFFLWADDNSSAGDRIDPLHLADSVIAYQPNADKIQERYNLPAGFVIEKLFTVGPVAIARTAVDVVFIKPDPEAIIACVENLTGSFSDRGRCPETEYVRICLKSPNLAQERIIEVYNNGQIAVRNPASKPELNNVCK